MTFSITLELTPDNLDKVKALFAEAPVPQEDQKKTPRKRAAKKAEPVTEEPTEAAVPFEETQISKTELRAVALEISKAGHNDDLKKIFASFGSENLSGIKKEDYAAAYKALMDVKEAL